VTGDRVTNGLLDRDCAVGLEVEVVVELAVSGDSECLTWAPAGSTTREFRREVTCTATPDNWPFVGTCFREDFRGGKGLLIPSKDVTTSSFGLLPSSVAGGLGNIWRLAVAMASDKAQLKGR